MMEEDIIKSLTLYISAWGWQIISMIFILGMLIAGLFQSIPVTIGLAGVVVATQLWSWRKKRDFMKYGEDREES